VHRVVELKPRKPLVVVDGEDHPYVRGIAPHADAYFKRETLRRALRLRARMPLRRLYHRRNYPDRWNDPLRRETGVATAASRSVIPLPFGLIDTGFEPSADKDVDVTFLARPTSPERAAVTEALRALERDGAVVLQLHVAKDDVGKVIGRQGRIARALRTIVRAGAARHSHRVLVEIVD
jgi:predicted RNA-binding protein YlqC (UPF0109 family)